MERITKNEKLTDEEGVPPTLTGFAPAGVPRAIGSVIDTRRGGVRALRRAIEELPDAETALTWLTKEVQAEQRQDVEVEVSSLEMDDAGHLHVDAIGDVMMTKTGFCQLLQVLKAPPHAGTYLPAIPSHRRAKEVNAIIDDQARRRRVLVLRQRRDGGQDKPVVFAAVTRRYTAVDPDTVALRLLEGGLAGMQQYGVEVVYSGERTAIRLFRHSETSSHELAVNEAFASVVELGLGDDKLSGLTVEVAAFRSLCRNLMLVAPDRQALYRARHTGCHTDLVSGLLNCVQRGAELLPQFLGRYTDARRNLVANPEDVILHITGAESNRKSGALVSLSNVRPQVMADRLLAAWTVESDASQSGIANAVTRAAHSFHWSSIWDTRELERQASHLLAAAPDRFSAIALPPATGGAA
ncbi:MAG: hypothetical protein H6707_03865 [Deltaproteobacteria bacterium]|nr:hypothetical protein [Deltaproteobacteria bacterium]